MKIFTETNARATKTLYLAADLIITGGGMAGVCCAITAAREGIKVILVQDRPVLGGNASSEVRLWILGATSHMGNNNRFAREGGVIDELLVENTYRNPEGNSVIFDTILLEKVIDEPNIRLLLNSAVYQVDKVNDEEIRSVTAYCSQNSTTYVLKAPFFCDASGDGIVGYLSGAAYRVGAESAEEFNEPFAPSKAYGELLGHSLYFMTKDLGKPVRFVPPSYALQDIKKIPRYRKFNARDHGCWLWWIEYGGRLDTVHDTEKIKWELWKVVYGVWNYIKNSGQFPEADTMTLEWVGLIPGKRESRRFEGRYMLTQSDIVSQRPFFDAVGHGGWAIDLHPADGVFSEKPGCNQWHSKGVYSIPFRCMISRNIHNLFLSGRIISASHVAFGSTRVMATCAHNAQAVGMGAALCLEKGWNPEKLVSENHITLLQQRLLRCGQYIPHIPLHEPGALLAHAQIDVSTNLVWNTFPTDGDWWPLSYSAAQLMPLQKGSRPTFTWRVKSELSTDIQVSFRTSSKAYNYTPDVILHEEMLPLQSGINEVSFSLQNPVDETGYYFLCFHQHDKIAIATSSHRVTGIVTVYNKQNIAVSNYGRQDPPSNLGFEAFEFWVPERRPGGKNFALSISPAIHLSATDELRNGFFRPYLKPNAWIADLSDPQPTITFEWPTEIDLQQIVLNFDTDWDYAMESSLLGHAENVMPFVVRDYKIYANDNELIITKKDNYQTRNVCTFDPIIRLNKLTFHFEHPSDKVPAAVFGIQCYSPAEKC